MLKLVMKNLKIIFRNKITFFSLILGPLLIIAIAGMAFNNTLSYEINVGVYSQEYTDVTIKFIDDLDSTFNVLEFIDNKSCVDSIISKGFHACIILPENMSVDGNVNEIELYFDNSRVNIASAIKDRVSDSLGRTGASISEDVTYNLIQSINFAEVELNKNIKELQQMKNEAESLESKSSSSRTTLLSSQLNFPKDNIKLGTIQTEFNRLSGSVNDIQDHSKSIVKEVKDSMNDIKDLNLGNSNLSKIVDDVISEANKFDSDIKKTNISSRISTLTSLMSTLSTELNKIESNLDSARTNTETVSKNLQEIISSLNSLSNKISTIESSSKNMIDNFLRNQIRDARTIVNPVIINEVEIVTGSKLNYLYPNLLILVLMFVTIISSATQIIGEKLNKAKQRMDMTPNPFLTNYIATFFTIFVISIIQILLILTMTHFLFGIDVITSLPLIFLILLISSIFFTLLGIVIGSLFNTEHTVMLASITVSSFFLILSDLILPIESMPAKLMEIIEFTPFIVSTSLIRKVMFFEIPFSEIATSFNLLIVMCVILLAILTINSFIYNLSKKTKASIMAKKISDKT